MEAHRQDVDWFAAAELIDLAPVPLFRTTLAGTITEANLAASELIGVERRFLMGSRWRCTSRTGGRSESLVARAAALPHRRDGRRRGRGRGAARAP